MTPVCMAHSTVLEMLRKATARRVPSTSPARSRSKTACCNNLWPASPLAGFFISCACKSNAARFSKINIKMSSNGISSGAVTLPIYLDNHATTPLDPRVLEAMLPYLTSRFGNAASSSHSFGWEAAGAVEKARRQIAASIGASPAEIVFTSAATESDNLAIKGVAEACREKGNHVITVVTEHKAVLDTCKHLEKSGFRVTYLPVQSNGLIDLDQLKDTFTNQTILVSIMAANNETGVLQPIEIG